MDRENSIELADLDAELAHINQQLEIFPDASARQEAENSFIVVRVNFRKSLGLKVVLQKDYPKVWPISQKMLAYEISGNLKPARQSQLKEFLAKQQATFNSIIDSCYGKCCIYQMVSATISALASDMLLSESLDALESQSKNKTLVENDLSAAVTVTEHTVDDDEAASPPRAKPSRQQVSTLSAKKPKNAGRATGSREDVEEPHKAKFRGADYIFDRIKWDESIDTDQVVIGYLDRFLGIKEIKFNEFKHVHDDYREGVPMHRIRHFRINDLIVYDRDKKLDMLTGEADLSKFFRTPVRATGSAGSGAKKADTVSLDRLSEAPILEWSSNEWRETTEKSKSTSALPAFSSGLKLLTYNIMSKVNFKHCITSLARDHANPAGAEGIYELDRMAKIVSTISSADQDLVLLQECDEYEELKLKESKFVRNNYFICSNPFRDCVILSKAKPKWHKLLKLSDERLGKLAVLTKFQVRSSSFKKVEEVLVVNVHLSSDKATNFLDKRKAQLEILKEFLVDTVDEHDLSADYTILAGDFNFGDESLKENSRMEHFFVQNGFRDLAPQVSTFDPRSNFSAAIASTKTFGRRMDRIYLRALRPHMSEMTSLNLVGTAPIELRRKSSSGSDDFVIFYEPYMKIEELTKAETVNIHPQHLAAQHFGQDSEVGDLLPDRVAKEPDAHYLHPSDHYGLQCSIKFKNALTDANLAHQSTLAILVPKGELSTALVQEIRSKHDPQFERWPAHLNMFYPFWSNIEPVRANDEDGTVIGDILSTLTAFRPFECEIDEFQTFGGGKSHVVYLAPSKESQSAISSVYKSLKTLFEDENHRTWKKELTAHLTIAQPEDKRKAAKDWAANKMTLIKDTYLGKLAELKQQGKNKFWVDCVYWMTRSGDQPFEVRFAFPLGSRYPHTVVGLDEHYLSSSDKSLLRFLHDKGMLASVQSEKHLFKAYESVLATLVDSLKSPTDTTAPFGQLDLARFNELSLFSANKKLSIIGSFVLGIAVHDLDLGLVVLESPEGYGEQVTDELLVRKLAQSDVVYTIRRIADAVVPIVEITLNSGSKFNSADVQLFSLPSSVASSFFSHDDANQLPKHYYSNFELMTKLGEKIADYNKFFALSGLFENQNIKRYVRYYKDFQVLLTLVKYWAQARGIYGKAFGYLSGISLALMAAYYLRKTPQAAYLDQVQLDNNSARFERLFVGFFKFYQAWNWSAPVSLVDLDHVTSSTQNLTNRPQTRASVSVLQSVFPYHNTTRNVNANSLQVFKSEILRVVSLTRELEVEQDSSKIYEFLEKACQARTLDEAVQESADRYIKFTISIRSVRDHSHITSLVKGKLYPLLKTVDNTNSSYRVYSNFFEPANTAGSDDIQVVFLIALNGSEALSESAKSYILSNCDELKRNSLAATHIPFDITYEAHL